MNTYDDILMEKEAPKVYTVEQKQEGAAQRDSEREYVFSLIQDAAEQMNKGLGVALKTAYAAGRSLGSGVSDLASGAVDAVNAVKDLKLFK